MARRPRQAGHRRFRHVRFVPTQIGAGNYIAHITVGFATLEDLERIEAEPFDAFPVRPVSVAIYHLGNSGAARSELKAWPLVSSRPGR